MPKEAKSWDKEIKNEFNARIMFEAELAITCVTCSQYRKEMS